MALPHWIDFFDDLQHVRGRSLNTVMAYRRDLELFDEFQAKKKDISQIYEYMKKKGLSARSQARVISSLRTYFKFCEKQGDKVPQLRQLRPPKVKVALPRVARTEDFERLYKACAVAAQPVRTARNQITLLLLFGLGVRVSELINIDVQDFNETEGWLCVTGKGSKQRLVPLTEHLMKELKAYLENARPQLLRQKTFSILINDKGNRPSRVDIWRWVAQWSKQAGFDEPISPHKFRHGCATALLEGGADLRSIQLLLGHSSIQTTQIYTSVSGKELKKAVDKYHPLAEVDFVED